MKIIHLCVQDDRGNYRTQCGRLLAYQWENPKVTKKYAYFPSYKRRHFVWSENLSRVTCKKCKSQYIVQQRDLIIDVLESELDNELTKVKDNI